MFCAEACCFVSYPGSLCDMIDVTLTSCLETDLGLLDPVVNVVVSWVVAEDSDCEPVKVVVGGGEKVCVKYAECGKSSLCECTEVSSDLGLFPSESLVSVVYGTHEG